LGKIAGIKHIFFDLDRTLWDFEKNSETVLTQLIKIYGLETKCNAGTAEIISKYQEVNRELWQQYSRKEIDKEQLRSSRFTKTLAHFNYHFLGFGLQLEKEYIERSPYQTHTIEGAHEILEYLKPSYKLHVLTNGFAEVQHIKLKQCNLNHFFQHVFISEEIGHQKPDLRIFDAAMKKTGAAAQECLMIGDDHYGDIQGALDAGWHAVHYSPIEELAGNHIQIRNLNQLREII
jgi:putative hydrolase of the HAD superfamily